MSLKEEKDKINTDGTMLFLQVTNLFRSMCKKDAVIKLTSLISSRTLIDAPYKHMGLTIQNFISSKERVVTTERAKVFSIIQGMGRQTTIC